MINKFRSLDELLTSKDRNFSIEEKQVLAKFMEEASKRAEIFAKQRRYSSPHSHSWKNSKLKTDKSFDE